MREKILKSELEKQYLEVMKKYLEHQIFNMPYFYRFDTELEPQTVTVVTYGAYEAPL